MGLQVTLPGVGVEGGFTLILVGFLFVPGLQFIEGEVLFLFQSYVVGEKYFLLSNLAFTIHITVHLLYYSILLSSYWKWYIIFCHF